MVVRVVHYHACSPFPFARRPNMFYWWLLCSSWLFKNICLMWVHFFFPGVHPWEKMWTLICWSRGTTTVARRGATGTSSFPPVVRAFSASTMWRESWSRCPSTCTLCCTDAVQRCTFVKLHRWSDQVQTLSLNSFTKRLDHAVLYTERYILRHTILIICKCIILIN